MAEAVYREFPPSAAVTRWVHCVWVFEAAEPGDTPERIVPDGRPELVIHFGEPYAEVDARGKLVVQPRVVFAGQVTKPLLLRATGRAGVVGVRFKPAGAKAFLGSSMRPATDRRVGLEEIDPRLAFSLAEVVRRRPDAAARAEAAAYLVHDRIEAVGIGEDLEVERCAERIEATSGMVDIGGLTEAAGIGRRQLERRFAEVVGIGPALLASIFRFRSVFDLIEHDASRPWTDAAVAAGYYDQSHFIREFRRFVGCTPSEFAKEKEGLAAALVSQSSK